MSRSAPPPTVDETASIVGVDTERLLAQYVLARLERRDRPVDM
jgi:hypothetical protein